MLEALAADQKVRLGFRRILVSGMGALSLSVNLV
jgi:hypothetical protein